MFVLQSNSDIEQPVIYLQGAMDHKAIKRFSHKFPLPESDIVLNFKHVSKFDSTGIGFLVKLFKYAYAKSYTIKFSDVPLKIRMFLELTQVDQIFEIVDNNSHQIANAA